MSGTAKNPVNLTGAQRRALRGLGHHLKPVVQIGKSGITDGLVEATEAALLQHELIKIAISGESPDGRKEAPELLATRAGAHVAQVIGRVALLYRRRSEDPSIELPGVIEEAPAS